MKIKNLEVALLATVLSVSLSVRSAEFLLDSSASEKAKGGFDVVLIGFSGSAEITDSQVDVNYDPGAVAVSVKALGSATCTNPKAGLIRVISPDQGGKALGEKVGAYCEITVKALKGGTVHNALKTSNAFCSGIGGAEKSCSAENASAK